MKGHIELTSLLDSFQRRKGQHEPVIEQVGSYDPVLNINNQQMVSLNYERIRHWLGAGAHLTKPVSELLGISGFLPVYPFTYQTAWRNRQQMKLKSAEEQEKTAQETPAA